MRIFSPGPDRPVARLAPYFRQDVVRRIRCRPAAAATGGVVTHMEQKIASRFMVIAAGERLAHAAARRTPGQGG